MMINWAEKQAPEDRHKLRTYNAMTHKPSITEFIESPSDLREHWQPYLSRTGAMIIDWLREVQRRKGELSREDAYYLCKACKTYTRMARKAKLSGSARATHTPARQRPQGNVGGLASAGDS